MPFVLLVHLSSGLISEVCPTVVGLETLPEESELSSTLGPGPSDSGEDYSGNHIALLIHVVTWLLIFKLTNGLSTSFLPTFLL